MFEFDLAHCPNCGAGELKIIAAILGGLVIEKILAHVGLDPQPPPRGRAREARQDRSRLSHAGRHKHLAPGRNAEPQRGQRRATRQRGTIGIRVNPDDMVTSERHARRRVRQNSIA